MTERNESTRYPIAAVRERVRRHGRPVLDFAVGPHRELPPTALLDMLRNVDDWWLRTPCSRDELDAFSDAAAVMLRRIYGVDAPPSAIMPVPGGRTAMSFLASTVIRPGDDVAVAEPAYRVTAFCHEGDFGMNPGSFWSADLEPPVSDGLAPFDP